ncbi:amino acid carrier protein [Ascidiimonas aurantiaca]|uniref:alanine/glycine:cation symporter family protein n=1 Tax=Ascidiimonas aurantiaca TaxID=1685432 RepID=UPI0030ED5D78
MNSINQLLSELIPYAEWLMLIFVIGGGLWLVLYSKGLPYRYFVHAIKVVSGKYSKGDAPGEISHLQALSSAVAATVGLGNISGVAIAIYHGGPGVVFWMWLTAIIGMCIKFYSCSLAVMFRKKLPDGQVLGGPMYYITLGLGPKFKPMAVFFCLAGLFGVLPVFTVNQFTQTLIRVVNPAETILPLSDFNWKFIIGITLVILTSLVIFGGLKKIAKVATSIVPFMVLLYFISVLIMMSLNSSSILPSLQLILNEAFNFNTAVQGGFWGLVILGVRRAVFSNESGVGTAPMFHGQSRTHEPVREGLVAMLGPFIDTIVVCTLTALVIIISGVYTNADNNGILMTLAAFEKLLFGYGAEILMILVSAFALSTLFTYSYYGVKCLTFITNARVGKWYNAVYILSITFAAVATVDMVTNLIDLSFAFMCLPNMIAVIWLAPHINRAATTYFKKMKHEKA